MAARKALSSAAMVSARSAALGLLGAFSCFSDGADLGAELGAGDCDGVLRNQRENRDIVDLRSIEGRVFYRRWKAGIFCFRPPFEPAGCEWQ
jgi:hypothetical protein